MSRSVSRRIGTGVAVAVMALAVVLAWLASQVNARANRDLLDRQVEQAATVLSFPPLLVTGGRAEFLDCPVGAPIGVGAPTAPTAPTAPVHTVPWPATLLAFTDGLVERRTEVIDVGLQRLRDAAAAAGTRPVEDVLDGVMAATAHDGGRDDTVLVGLRWT